MGLVVEKVVQMYRNYKSMELSPKYSLDLQNYGSNILQMIGGGNSSPRALAHTRFFFIRNKDQAIVLKVS